MNDLSRTEYLFGYTKDKYGDCLVKLARERIDDANALLVGLMSERSYLPSEQGEYQEFLSSRIYEVIDARDTWRKILEEEI